MLHRSKSCLHKCCDKNNIQFVDIKNSFDIHCLYDFLGAHVTLHAGGESNFMGHHVIMFLNSDYVI